MSPQRLEKRAARWQELRERCNDAAGKLYVATVRMTDAQYKGTARVIAAAEQAVAVAERQYERARSVLATFVAKSVKS